VRFVQYILKKVYRMSTRAITLTDLKQSLGEIVNQAAYGDERILLMSRGKARAALISIEDLRKLEMLEQLDQQRQTQTAQFALLDELRQLRQSMANTGVTTDSVEVLREIREERVNDLTGLC
jgi:prevent-host-death family protein